MILVKTSKPFQRNLTFIPYEDFLWFAKVANVGYSEPSFLATLGFSDYADSVNTFTTEIRQVYVDNALYTEAASIAASKLIEKSWFFNNSTQELYINVDHAKLMSGSEFDSLEIKGYCSGESIFEDSNDNVYKPLLRSSFELSDEVDQGIFEKMSFVSNTLEFFNQLKNDGTGEFDYTLIAPAPGADVDILYISQADLDSGKKTLRQLYKGFAESDGIEDGKYIIKVADKREQLNAKYPNTYFDATTYTLMEDDLDELIPEGYGDLVGCPAFCINDSVSSGDVLYKYATDGTTLTTVYVKIDEKWTAKTPTASSGTACTFTLSTGDGRASSGAPYEAKVDCRLRDIDSPSLILADMITRYIGYPFTADYFDFNVWTDEGSLLEDVALYMAERKEFFEWVEPLQNGSSRGFIFRINPDGKYWIKADDITRIVKQTFIQMDNINDSRNITTDFTNYATDVEILYNKDQESDKYSRVTDDQFKETTLDTYRLEKELSFKTLLTSQANAEARAENNLKEYKKARPLHSVAFRGIIDCGLLDVVIYDSSICLSETCERDYAGVVKLKLASYSYDFENEITFLTGYDISDIVSKGTEIESQGKLNGLYTINGLTNINGPTAVYTPEEG